MVSGRANCSLHCWGVDVPQHHPELNCATLAFVLREVNLPPSALDGREPGHRADFIEGTRGVFKDSITEG